MLKKCALLVPVVLILLAAGVSADSPDAELEILLGEDSTTCALGQAPEPTPMSGTGQWACYPDDSICESIYGVGCPTGTSCAVGASSTAQGCCISGPFACVQTCDFSANQCNSLCSH